MICQLVPEAAGGVQDFALKLRDSLGVDGAEVHAYSRGSARELRLSSDSVLLHYSGYGFAKRGAPLWVLDDLRRRRPEIKRLGVFFHELYAFAAPWRSGFWLSPAQRWVARQLADMSDFWMTNRDASARWLRRSAVDKPSAVLPVFSTVGEMQECSADRRPKIVIFGRDGLRAETYRAAGRDLFVWSRREGLEVHDIGPPIQDAALADRLRREGVILHGRLEAGSVSEQLSNAKFGLVSYPIEYLAKSSVFAALCSHGVCAVLLSRNHVLSDGLAAEIQYLPGIPVGLSGLGAAQSMGQAAWQWYQPHKLACHVETLRRLCSRLRP